MRAHQPIDFRPCALHEPGRRRRRPDISPCGNAPARNSSARSAGLVAVLPVSNTVPPRCKPSRWRISSADLRVHVFDAGNSPRQFLVHHLANAALAARQPWYWFRPPTGRRLPAASGTAIPVCHPGPQARCVPRVDSPRSRNVKKSANRLTASCAGPRRVCCHLLQLGRDVVVLPAATDRTAVVLRAHVLDIAGNLSFQL